ncbi:unnamed protein product, partial [Meganyctiphanes norvegica]
MKLLLKMKTLFGLVTVKNEDVPLFFHVVDTTYLADVGAVVPEDIADLADVCTHLIYAFAGINEGTSEIEVTDPTADLCPGDPGAEAWSHCGIKKITDLKNGHPSLKILIAVGGAGSTDIFSKVLHQIDSRFILPFLAKNCYYISHKNKNLLLALLSFFVEAHIPGGICQVWLMIIISMGRRRRIGYDVPSISKHVDLIHVMAYDYHGAWAPTTHHNAPLYQHHTDFNEYLTVDYSIHYWLSKGAPADKLILGLPMYGRCWTLDDYLYHHGIGAPGTPGPSGPNSATPGLLFYSEICKDQKNHQGDWTIVNDEEMEVPYGYRNKVWCGYDHEESIANKAIHIDNVCLERIIAMAAAGNNTSWKRNCCDQNPTLQRVVSQWLVSSGAKIQDVTPSGPHTAMKGPGASCEHGPPLPPSPPIPITKKT